MGVDKYHIKFSTCSKQVFIFVLIKIDTECIVDKKRGLSVVNVNSIAQTRYIKIMHYANTRQKCFFTLKYANSNLLICE